MASPFRHAFCFGIGLVLLPFLFSLSASAQVADTTTQKIERTNGLQFLLPGDMGAYFVGSRNGTPSYRVGVDISLGFSSRSGSDYSYSYYTSGIAESEQGDAASKGRSYKIAVSGLFLQQLLQFDASQLYCGLGPIATYGWDRTTQENPNTYLQSEDFSTHTGGTMETTDKSTGVGPMFIIGIKTRVTDHLSACAESQMAASYEWNTITNSSEIWHGSPGSPQHIGSIVHLKGWTYVITPLRLGMILEF